MEAPPTGTGASVDSCRRAVVAVGRSEEDVRFLSYRSWVIPEVLAGLLPFGRLSEDEAVWIGIVNRLG